MYIIFNDDSGTKTEILSFRAADDGTYHMRAILPNSYDDTKYDYLHNLTITDTKIYNDSDTIIFHTTKYDAIDNIAWESTEDGNIEVSMNFRVSDRAYSD